MAAILNTRNGYLNGTTSGWVARSLFPVGNNLYAVVLNTSTAKIEVYKSASGGALTLQDTGGSVQHTNALHSYDANVALSHDGYIYIAYRTATNTVRVRRFSTTTDTWETSDVGGANAATNASETTGLGLAVRSNGDVLLFYRGAVTNVGIGRTSRCVSGTWTVDQLLLGGSTSLIQSACMVGSADLAHIFINDTGASDATFQSYLASNANGFGVAPDFDVSVQQPVFSGFGSWVDDGGTARGAYAYADSGGELDFSWYTNLTNPPLADTIVSGVSDTGHDPSRLGATVVAYSGQWHVLWAQGGAGTIWRDVSDDFATPAFGTDASVVTGLGNDPPLYAVAAATGIPVLYTDPTTTSTEIVWAVGSPPAGGTDALGTVSEDTVAITGSTFTGSAGQGAVGAVSEDAVSVVGSSITGAAGQSATVAEDSIAIVGSALTGSAGQGSVGTVAEDIVPIEGFNLTGSAGQSAVVSEDSVAVTGAIITGSAGQRAEGTVLEGLVSITGGAITATAAGSDIATVFADTVPITGGVFTGTAGQGAVGTVSEGVVSLSGGLVEAGISFSALVSGSLVSLSGGQIDGASGVQATVDETVVAISGTVITGGSSVLGTVLVDNIVIAGSTISGSASVRADVDTGTIIITGENISGFIVYNTGPMYGIFSYTDAITGELSYTEIFDGTLSGTFRAEEVVSALFSSE